MGRYFDDWNDVTKEDILHYGVKDMKWGKKKAKADYDMGQLNGKAKKIFSSNRSAFDYHKEDGEKTQNLKNKGHSDSSRPARKKLKKDLKW